MTTQTLEANSTTSVNTAEKKIPFQADQQAKFLHLQAEAESLLQHLQALKQQRQAGDRQEAPVS